MKIIFVGNTSWSMWNFRRDVMLSLKSDGHEIFVLAPEDSFSSEIQKHFAFHALRCLARKGKNPFRDIALTYELRTLYKAIEPDYIFQYTIKPNIFGSIAALGLRASVYSMIAGMGYSFQNRGLLTAIVSRLYKIASCRSRKLLFLNPDDAQDFQALGILKPDSTNSLVLPGEGVDLNFFKNLDPKFSGAGRATFVFVGRLLRDKGILDFLHLAEEIKKREPKIEFKVVGDVDEGNPLSIKREEIEDFHMRGHVNYLGPLADVRSVLSSSDALIFPSTYGEGLSRVVLEACAMERCVISYNNRGSRPLVRNGENGFLIANNNFAELYQCVRAFIDFGECQKRELGSRARSSVEERFGMENVIQIYRNLVKRAQ